MSSQIEGRVLVLALIIAGLASPLLAQQKGQWVPGQAGLDAGILPDAGFTYASLNVNYSANALNDSNGNKRPGITGTLSFWAIENACPSSKHSATVESTSWPKARLTRFG